MARIERLVNLIAALLDTPRPLSRSDIHERVPGYSSDAAAFRRAFERDKETLRVMGMPLRTEPLDPEYPEMGSGYRIPKEQYILADPKLTRQEAQALALAASAVKLKSQAASAALWKLGASTSGAGESLQESVELPDDDHLAAVFSARNERKQIEFGYKGRKRTLEPHRLSFRNGQWYVSGFDTDNDEQRTYRLDRFEGEVWASAPNAFEPPISEPQPWRPPWQMGDDPPFQALVLVDANHVDLTLRQAPDAQCERHSDGSATISFTVTNPNAFRSFVLGLLDHAEIVSPPESRDDMLTYLQSLVEA